jgi:hypothetical protein
MHGFSKFKLSPDDWDSLEALQAVLSVPHKYQQAISSELMPVLLQGVIYLERLMTNWKSLGKRYRQLKPWTEVGVQWATKYYIQMDNTDAYVVTMCKSLLYYWRH